MFIEVFSTELGTLECWNLSHGFNKLFFSQIIAHILIYDLILHIHLLIALLHRWLALVQQLHEQLIMLVLQQGPVTNRRANNLLNLIPSI